MLKNKFIKLSRTFKEGARNFFRNGWLSIATIVILIMTLYVVSATFLLGVTARTIIANIEENIDVSIYLKEDVTGSQAMEIKSKIERLEEIRSVEYISTEEALERFISSEVGSNVVIQEALSEIGGNPLLSSLIIKTNKTEDYEVVVRFIENSTFLESIDKINYGENKENIETLNSVIRSTENIGIVLGVIFVMIAILITFNTIRLTMYSRKKEFEVMRLVGASNMYVRMPSIFEGLFYGSVSACITTGLIFTTVRALSPLMNRLIPQNDLVAFYMQYFWQIFALILLAGISLGVVSSLIAIRRYLKI